MNNPLVLDRKSIYKHDQLEEKVAGKFKPLIENAFRTELSRYEGSPKASGRDNIAKERISFAANQYANRARVSEMVGEKPLFEDSQIFKGIGNLSKFFESASESITGMGEFSSPGVSTSLTGGIWNPGYKPGSGDIPSYIFGLQNHIALNCIGFDLMPVIATDTPVVRVQYVDTVYGGGTFDRLGYNPSYMEIVCYLFTYSFIKTKALERATSEVVIRANDGKALKVRFMLGSLVHPAMTVEVLATGTSTIETSTITYTWDNSVTIKAVIDAVNLETGARVWAGAGTGDTITDNTDGTAIDHAKAALTIGYASAVRTNIAEAASNNNSLGGMARAQQEKGPIHRLQVVTLDKQIEMVGLEIEANTTNIQIKDMAAVGVNVISHLYTGVQNQLIQSLDEVILTHLYRMGVQHAVNVYQSQGENFSLFISAPATTTKDMSAVDVVFQDMTGTDRRDDMGDITNSITSAGYENQTTHAERLYSRILEIVEFGSYQNRIGCYDFLVAGGTMCATLKKHASYSVCPSVTSMKTSPELQYAGTIFESVNVYKNPKIRFRDPRILFGRRGDDKDPGSKFLAYDLAASRQTIDPTTMAELIRVWSRFAIADIGFYPELNYYVGVFINDNNWA
jgi:hypothetical protein